MPHFWYFQGMLTRLLQCLLLFALAVAHARAGEWETYLEEARARVSHESHLPYRLTHGHKTPRSVLLVHGIYSSPLYFRGMAEAFFRAGHNVVTVLLPGHFEKDWYSMRQVHGSDWSAEVDRGYQLARELGEQVVLAGHSLGGLLSWEQAAKRPAGEVAGLVIISPALKVQDAVLAACRAGRGVGLSGNFFVRARPDGVRVPHFDPVAGPLIQGVADRVLAGPLPRVPLFMAYTWNDNVLDVVALRRHYLRMPGPKQRYVYAFRLGGVDHGSISQSPQDEATFGNGRNPDFGRMMQQALDFLERH